MTPNALVTMATNADAANHDTFTPLLRRVSITVIRLTKSFTVWSMSLSHNC